MRESTASDYMDNNVVKASLRIEPISLSAYPFSQGERDDVGPIANSRPIAKEPKANQRSGFGVI